MIIYFNSILNQLKINEKKFAMGFCKKIDIALLCAYFNRKMNQYDSKKQEMNRQINNKVIVFMNIA